MQIKRDEQGRWAKGNNSGQRFTSERSRGNKHAQGNPPNKTSFRKGEHAMEKHPNWNGGVQKMSKDCFYLQFPDGVRVRRPKYVWEQVYGELPKGYVIWHIDGDRYNDNIDNLEAITRGEMARRNRTKEL